MERLSLFNSISTINHLFCFDTIIFTRTYNYSINCAYFHSYVVITFSVLIFVLAGILFPPYHDNPFSVITSIAVVTIPILVIGISLTFLNLNLWLNISIVIFFYIVIVLFSIQGLINMKRGFRHETFIHIH